MAMMEKVGRGRGDPVPGTCTQVIRRARGLSLRYATAKRTPAALTRDQDIKDSTAFMSVK